MWPIKIVLHPCPREASLWALAAVVWLGLSAVVPGSARDEVRPYAGHPKFVRRALPVHGEKLYGTCKNPRSRGIEVEIAESGLRCKPRIMVQRMSVAYTVWLDPGTGLKPDKCLAPWNNCEHHAAKRIEASWAATFQGSRSSILLIGHAAMRSST
jgi:hypothetical protein